MIYPSNFESKIGFDRIRQLLSDRCLSPMGKTMAGSVSFMYDENLVVTEVSKTAEFQQVLTFGEPFPSDNYLDISEILGKLKVEGSFPEVQELFDLKRTLETIRAVVNYFKAGDEKSYPIHKSLCRNVTIYPYVTDAIDRILDRHGNIKDSHIRWFLFNKT